MRRARWRWFNPWNGPLFVRVSLNLTRWTFGLASACDLELHFGPLLLEFEWHPA